MNDVAMSTCVCLSALLVNATSEFLIFFASEIKMRFVHSISISVLHGWIISKKKQLSFMFKSLKK